MHLHVTTQRRPWQQHINMLLEQIEVLDINAFTCNNTAIVISVEIMPHVKAYTVTWPSQFPQYRHVLFHRLCTAFIQRTPSTPCTNRHSSAASSKRRRYMDTQERGQRSGIDTIKYHS